MLQQVESRTSPWPPAMPPAAAERTSGDWTSILEMDVQATWSSAGDSRQGHDCMHARFYSPPMGRFFSPDPSGASFDPAEPQSWNRNAYIRNNPMKHVDPDGKVLDVIADIGFIGWLFGPGQESRAEDSSMLLLGGTAVAGGSPLQRLDELLLDSSEDELCHLSSH